MVNVHRCGPNTSKMLRVTVQNDTIISIRIQEPLLTPEFSISIFQPCSLFGVGIAAN